MPFEIYWKYNTHDDDATQWDEEKKDAPTKIKHLDTHTHHYDWVVEQIPVEPILVSN